MLLYLLKSVITVFATGNSPGNTDLHHCQLSETVCVISDEWVMFDDHRVSPVTAADVQKLSGGGAFCSRSHICLSHGRNAFGLAISL